MMRKMVIPLLLVFSIAACGGTTKVGGELTLGGGKGGALGKFTQEPSAKASTSKKPTAKATTKVDQNKEDAKRASVKVVINESGYDPYYIRIFVGSIVSFTNKDAQDRSVTGDKNEFDSGWIKPGGVWSYKGTTPGKFNFHDASRPFVVGTVEVLAK